MSKIAIKQTWQSYEDDAARNWIPASYSNVRQPTSARTIENLAHGFNHLAAKTPRPMFGASATRGLTTAAGKDPLYEWAYEDEVHNGRTYTITVVGLPRTTTNVGNSSIKQWDTSDLRDNDANGADRNDTAYTSINAFYDAFYEEISVTRNNEANARVVDGVSTYNGYTTLHVGVQEKELYSLYTDVHVYCDPSLAKKAGKILDDIPSDIAGAFHNLRSTNLPIVFSYASQGGALQNHLNTTPANLFDTSVGARSADSPGSIYDAQYCGRGEIANVKVYVAIKGTLTAGDATPGNVYFIGPLDQSIISVAPSDAGWHGNADHAIHLSTVARGTWSNIDANKIDVLASVNATGDFFEWSAVRCWIEYD